MNDQTFVGFVPLKGSIVACPSWLIPSLRNTFQMVSNKIFRSRPKLKWSTYQTSSSNFCSQDIAFLPLTWAQPVIPGSTSCRLCCSLVYKGRYCSNKGLGPTKLISPFNTFINWGISSREVFLTKRPIGVKRWASGKRFPSSSLRSFIVLNLTTRKILPFFPGRLWKKNGSPRLDIARTITTVKKTGDKRRRPKRAAEKSIARFPMRWYIMGHKINESLVIPFKFPSGNKSGQARLFMENGPWWHENLFESRNIVILRNDFQSKILNLPSKTLNIIMT